MTVFPTGRTMSADLFEPDRPWLARQPRMNSWLKSRSLLMQQLEQWQEEYARPWCADAAKAAGHPGYRAYLRRMWECWSYHWRNAAAASARRKVDGWDVAECLRAGRSPDRKANLGGNPLRDVVLAEAVLQRDGDATTLFVKEYQDFAVRMAGRMGTCFTADLGWWSELMDNLAGYSRSPGKLDGFAGRCGLQNWLGTVVRRFLWDRARSERRESTASVEEVVEQATTDNPPERDLISAECLQRFQHLLTDALTKMSRDDAATLYLLYGEGLAGKDVGRILGKHPGNVSRQAERALDMLRTHLEQREAEESREKDAYRQCLQHLLAGSDRLSFAHCLIGALGEAADGGDRP